MEPLGWQRIRLDPSTPLWWRTDGTLVIGHADDSASAAVEARERASEFSTLTQLLDGTHAAHSLLQTGQAMGIPAIDVRRFLVALAEAGHIHEVEVEAAPLLAHSAVRNVRHLARVRGIEESQALEQRQDFRVLIVGIGAVAAQLFANCTQAGLTTGWSTHSSRKIRIDDCTTVGLNPDTIGMAWSDLAEPIRDPDLIVVVAQTYAGFELIEKYGTRLLLPLIVHQRRMSIGPLLNTSEGPCAACTDVERARADPDWAYRQAQLRSMDLAPPVLSDAFRDAFVGSAMAWILELVDTSHTHGLHETSWELLPPIPVWQTRHWARAESCSCNDFREVATAI